MKKTNARRIVSFILVLLMVLSIAACGNTTTPEVSASASTSASKEATATSENPAVEDGPFTPYAEPITITWAVPASAVQKFRDGDTYEDNLWSRKIKEELNIDVKVAFTADASTDAFRNKMNVSLASGDLPDIMYWGDRTFFKQAYDAGYLADITDPFEQYATDPVKEFRNKFPECFEGASKDGRLYGFPYMTDNFYDAVFLWIRDDWLANTNSKPPTTVPEMLELARKFTFEDPDGNGKDDTYGFGLSNKVVNTTYGSLLGLVHAYGLPGFGPGGIFYRGKDDKITFPYIQPEMKEVLSIARKMYEDGIIDPEFIVKDNPMIETDVTNGKVGMMYHMCWGDWLPFNLSYEADGVITRPYPIPTVEGTEYKIGINSNKIGNLYMLNSKYEHPEAFVKILNLYSKTCIETTNAEDFKTYWADEQYRLCPVTLGIPTPELFADVLLDAIKKGTSEGLPANLQTVYGYIKDFESGANTDPNAYGTWGQMNSRGSVVIAMTDYKGHIISNLMENNLPEVWIQNSSILETLINTSFTDIITGNKPLDYFDQFVTEWLKAGGQETIDELEKTTKK